jgi:hypothetical protein
VDSKEFKALQELRVLLELQDYKEKPVLPACKE